MEMVDLRWKKNGCDRFGGASQVWWNGGSENEG